MRAMNPEKESHHMDNNTQHIGVVNIQQSIQILYLRATTVGSSKIKVNN